MKYHLKVYLDEAMGFDFQQTEEFAKSQINYGWELISVQPCKLDDYEYEIIVECKNPEKVTSLPYPPSFFRNC